MSKGCKQVPLDHSRGIVRWGHPDGYFLNARGERVKDSFGPAMQRGFTPANPSSGGYTGSCYPIDRATDVNSHILMALAFYGPRPTYTGKNGKPYVGICHHLIPDKLDYRPANLLCWLTREEHAEADRRQRALRKIVPNGALSVFTMEYLRFVQNPIILSREGFEKILSEIQLKIERGEPYGL